MKRCPDCGMLHEDSATKCEKCGSRLTGLEAYRPINDHLAGAILVTIFCCLPFGVVAIVYAAQVKGMIRMGDMRGAAQASDTADFWVKISFWIGIATGILGVLAALMK